MSTDINKAHIHIQVERTLHDRVLRCIPWGTRSNIFRNLLEMVVMAVEKHGDAMVGALISGRFRLVYIEEKEDETRTHSKVSRSNGP